MIFKKIFLLCILPFISFAGEIYIDFDNHVYRADNIHSFESAKVRNPAAMLLVSSKRDIFLESVNSSVKNKSFVKSPSILYAGQKIELENDENQVTGRIIHAGKYFIQCDLAVKRGDSGKLVCTADKKTLGLVSYCTNKYTFVVRIDNLSNDEFEKISPQQLQCDQKIFAAQKEYEYQLIDGLKKCQTPRSFKLFLQNNPPPAIKYTRWHSTYLKNKFIESENVVRKIFECSSI